MPNPTRTKPEFYYSEKYYDDVYEYRHVHIPKELAKNIPKDRLMTENEWRSLGVAQSLGWVHYMLHGPERHILLFRRPRTDLQNHDQRGAAVGKKGTAIKHAA